MSLDGLRDALHKEKTHEIAKSATAHKRKLRELYRVSEVCSAALNAGYQPKIDDFNLGEPKEKERRFLDENDLTKGRHFNDATLPFAIVPTDQQPSLPSTLPFPNSAQSFPPHPKSPLSNADAPSLEDQLRAASASPSVVNPSLPPNSSSPHAETAHATSPETFSSLTEPALVDHRGTSTAQANASSTASSPKSPIAQNINGQRSAGSDVSPLSTNTIAAPTSQVIASAASSPNAAASTSNIEHNQKASRIARSPPIEGQEVKRQEAERKRERTAEKEKREVEKLTIPHTSGSVDVSSPSSTVGPYSQTTPHAPHHSPDTSPDTASYHEPSHPLEPGEDALDPAAEQVKQDHERAMQKRMKEAQERAREENSPTPDIEKQIENEQAIRLARDGKIRSDDVLSRPGLQPMLQGTDETEQSIGLEHEETTDSKAVHDHAADSLPTPTTTAPEPSTVDRDVTDNLEPQQEASSIPPDQPTPPADADTEMVDSSPEEKLRKLPNSPPGPSERMNPRINTELEQQHRTSNSTETKTGPKAMAAPHPNSSSTTVSPLRPKSSHRRSQEVSTIIFAKKTPNRSSKALQSYNEDYASLQGASEDASRDYLEGLFKYQAHHPPRSAPLQDLVSSARKTVSTAGTLAMVREHQDYKILKRVYQLQNANRWSLRQLQKAVEPERPFTHQDQLLLEMKWMQTDFREERKWKKALAAMFAEWCAEYVNSKPAEQAILRVNSRIPQSASQSRYEDEEMNDAPTPELVHSGANETESESYADEEELRTPLNANPPAGLFSLGYNDVVMKIERTPASDTMFRELPFYEPMLESSSDFNPLSVSESPILPVSKFVTGKLVSQIRGPPKKRSRYDYDSEDEPSSPPSRAGTSAEHSMPSTPGRRLFCRNDLPPEITDVALFNAENKHVRDRLQVAHQFRPPTEFNMPSVAFFENRTPSQWLWEEDQKLRALVKEYTFNWSLVSQQLSLPSMFVSGSGRRTPWECFERWVQLEGLPAEMSKTQYFRTYQGRLEQANKTVFAQFQAQQQQQQQQGQTPGQPRRRPTTTPIRVERRRENRHLAIIDGMRKLARKRESAAHKQTESQKAAALRKAHEPAPPKNNVHTPQEFSRLKWEREEKLKQRQLQQEMLLRVRLNAQKEIMADKEQQQMAAQRQAQMQAQPGMSNGVNQMQRNGTSGSNGSIPTQMANASSQQGQNAPAMTARTHQGQQGMQTNFANGNMAGMSMGTPGVPQAQMQANMQNAARMGPPDQMRMAMQRGQFQNANQQHQFQLQQQQINMASNITQGMAIGMNGIPNANMIASMSNQNLNGNMNGAMSSAMNGMANNGSSPRMNPGTAAMQNAARPLSSGHMPQLLQIQNNLKVQHPDWPPEQVQKVASDQLTRFLSKQRVQAMNAAAGNAASGSSGMSAPQMGNNHYLQNGGMANGAQPSTVHTYQQQLVQQQRLMSQQQQQRQQAGSSPALNGRPLSRSATPQNPQMQHSPGLQAAQINRS